jgi:toxin ParE1/3/4
MHKVHLSVRAEKDLLDIWQYTFAHWDEAQADKYVDELDQSIQLLADNPEMGTSRNYLRKGYRVLFMNRHAVYYTVRGSTVRIVRILHGQMDPEQHL